MLLTTNTLFIKKKSYVEENLDWNEILMFYILNLFFADLFSGHYPLHYPLFAS